MNFPAPTIGVASDALGTGGPTEIPEDSPFRHFVDAVTRHVSGICRDDTDLAFVFQPLIRSHNACAGTEGDPESDSPCGALRLESPWARLALQRSPDRLVRARFFWNERQFLNDQALLSGEQARRGQPLMPITEQVFAALAEDYAQAVLCAPSPEAAARAVVEVSGRIPPDIFWLFQHAWQSTRGPFIEFARAALSETVRQAAPTYTELVKTLIDRRIASADATQRYDDILDLADPGTLGRYRIDRLR